MDWSKQVQIKIFLSFNLWLICLPCHSHVLPKRIYFSFFRAVVSSWRMCRWSSAECPCTKFMFASILQYQELLLASYNTNPETPHEPDGVCLVWNSLFKKDSPEYIFHCQVKRDFWFFWRTGVQELLFCSLNI